MFPRMFEVAVNSINLYEGSFIRLCLEYGSVSDLTKYFSVDVVLCRYPQIEGPERYDDTHRHRKQVTV